MAYFEDNTISHDITTDAGFRAWGQMVHDGFLAVGLVNTADTGQIDLRTVATPGTNGTFAGYEIWRFDDADQATEPIYFKFEYGRGGLASNPNYRITVGTGSNGSGTISNASAALTAGMAASIGTKGYIHMALVDGAFHFFLCIKTDQNDENNFRTTQIERMKTADTQALMSRILVAGVSNKIWEAPTMRSSGVWSTGSPNVGLSQYPGSSAAANVVAPGFSRPLNPAPGAPLLSYMVFRAGLAGAGDSGIINVRGVDRTYKRVPMLSVATALYEKQSTSVSSVNCDVLVIHE